MKLKLDEMTEFVDKNSSHSFYYSDVVHPETKENFRIFGYRLASIRTFYDLAPLSFWCRGTMFSLDTGKLVCRPMPKFFNVQEYIAAGIPLPSGTWEIIEKYDGSLISTYFSKVKLYMKSKMSLESEMAIESQKIIENNTFMFSGLMHDYTHNYEYVSPDNHVVVPYTETDLKFLCRVHNETGLVLPTLAHKSISIQSIKEMEDFAHKVYNGDFKITDGLEEGFVLHHPDSNLIVKVKNSEYLKLHKLMDLTNSKWNLIEAIVKEEVDDLISQILDVYGKEKAEQVLSKVNEYSSIINSWMHTSETIFSKLKHLSNKKEFALALKEEVKNYNFSFLFSTVMNMYLGREIDWLSIARKEKNEF